MATATATAEILLYSDIGEANATAYTFRRDLNDLRDEPSVDIRINSPGGSVIEGMGIIEAILDARARGQFITTYNDGACFSMAACIFQAGSRRIMGEHALLMFHAASTQRGGNRHAMTRAAEELRRADEQLIGMLIKQTKKPESYVRKWFDGEEHFFDCAEARAEGLCDLRYIHPSSRAQNVTDIFAKYSVPSKYKVAIRAPIEEALAQVEQLAKFACDSLYWSTFDYRRREAARIAKALNDRPGVTSDDRDRILAALDRIEKFRDWPPYELK